MPSRDRVLLLSFLLAACGDGAAADDDTPAASTTEPSATGAATGTAPTPGDIDEDANVRPNWHEDIAPLVAAHCQGCHSEGGIAPFGLERYADASAWASAMASSVADGLMPPWHALETEACQPPLPYKHDPRLTAAEKQLFRSWADLGAPEGDPSRAAPIPPPTSLDLPDPSATVVMEAPLTIEPSDTSLDSFHCLSLDPGNAETVYLDGMQVIAGNDKVVHHVLIFIDPDAASAGWQDGVQQNCGSWAGILNAQLIGAWVPGGMPTETPQGVGIELKAGQRMILNVHYHATGEGPEVDDGTGLALRWKTAPPAWVSSFTLLGAPGLSESLTGPLMIPADTRGHIEDYTYTVSVAGLPFPDEIEVRLSSLLGHMHKVGVDMRVWLEDRDTGQETCLLHIPRWDFDWQRQYAFAVPITESVRVRAGDKLRIRCAYDNTVDNPGVLEALAELGLDAPIDVNLGEGTLDEMCVTGVGVAIKTGP